LDPGARGLHPDPAEDLHLGIGYRRRADAAVPGQHAGGARQARVPGRAGDPAGRRTRPGRAAPLDRTHRLDCGRTACRDWRLPGVEGTRRMTVMTRSGVCLMVAAALVLAGCASSRVVSRTASGSVRGPVAVSTPKPGVVVTVQRGQNLYRIATDNGITLRDLAAWNGIRSPYTIHPGQRLRLYPGGGGNPTVRNPPPRKPAPTTGPPATAP